MKEYYYFNLKGDQIFFEVNKLSGTVIKFQRSTKAKNRHSIIGITEISYISFYGRYLNWLSKWDNATFMQITQQKFQQEVKEYFNSIIQ